MLVVADASGAAAARARAAGWSLVTDDGPAWVRFSDHDVLELPGATPQPPVPRRRGPASRGATTLVRRLLLPGADTTQRGLAALSGVSQPRVSQVFRMLSAAGLIRRTGSGWTATDWDALCDWWLAHYPGPGGLTTWWAGVGTPGELAVTTLSVLPAGAVPVVSGDVAADLIAPWRRPALTVVYARRGVDLVDAGLVPLPSPEGALLAFTVPEDVGVWPPEPTVRTWRATDVPIADELQILYDLERSPGPDAQEAADRWRRRLREMWSSR